MLLQADPDPALAAACGDDPSFVCRQVFGWTDSADWAEFADLVVGKLLTILLVLLVAWLVNLIVRRLIGRFVASMSGEQPPNRRLKQRLRNTRLGEQVPGVFDTGQVSLRRPHVRRRSDWSCAASPRL